MSRELCPRCGEERNMEVSVSRRRAVDAEGKAREVVTRTWHCEVCHGFVRSQEAEVEGQ
jgi:hypothetical protein